MKCQFCNKNIDEVDTTCKMCTICGWAIEAIVSDPPGKKIEEARVKPPSGAEK